MYTKFLNLGMQPIANGFLAADELVNERKYPLVVGFDEKTCLVSLIHLVPPNRLFNDSYAYRSSQSATMREHFKQAADIVKGYQPKLVLEIGSNDGAFLRNFDPSIIHSVEPCSNFAAETQKLGYITHNIFWDNQSVKKQMPDRYDVIYSANCMCHIPAIGEAFDLVYDSLRDDGVFIFEDPSVAEMLVRNSYDQIYDEHAHLFSVIGLRNVLNSANLEIVKVERLSTHGGSNRIYAKRLSTNLYIDPSVESAIVAERMLGLYDLQTYLDFGQRVQESRQQLKELLNKLVADNKTIIGYGATSKSTVVYNYCGFTVSHLKYIVDTTPEKQGKFSPGVHIPIVPSHADGIAPDVDYAFLGAWNFETEILAKEWRFVERGGKFITHVPNVRII